MLKASLCVVRKRDFFFLLELKDKQTMENLIFSSETENEKYSNFVKTKK